MSRAYLQTLLVTVTSIVIDSTALAGNWSSGGGEILEHAQNPWFLETPSSHQPIRYCVMHGSDFPMSSEQLESLVVGSFRWWDSQFSSAFYPENTIYVGGKPQVLKVQLNTSRFELVGCSEHPDLTFQFGILTADQIAEFQRRQIDLTRYVALTIRTDYDQAMRGRGFIYISPDRGPMAFKGQNVRPEAWTFDEGHTLQSVIIHELGHVHGLAHSGSDDSIMSARHAEQVVSKGFSPESYLAMANAVFFPKPGEVIRDCDSRSKAKEFRAFFEIPDEMQCFRVSLSLNSLRIEAAEKSDESYRLVGTARFKDGGNRRHQQLVTLWLPQNQEAYPGAMMIGTSLLGPAASEVQHSAVFAFANGVLRPKSIFVQASARYVQIGGLTDKGLVPDLLPVTSYGRGISGWGQN